MSSPTPSVVFGEQRGSLPDSSNQGFTAKLIKTRADDMRRTVSDLKQSDKGVFDAVEHYIGMTNA